MCVSGENAIAGSRNYLSLSALRRGDQAVNHQRPFSAESHQAREEPPKLHINALPKKMELLKSTEVTEEHAESYSVLVEN